MKRGVLMLYRNTFSATTVFEETLSDSYGILIMDIYIKGKATMLILVYCAPIGSAISSYRLTAVSKI